ncbi:hypothetical protein [Staphylococcus aureus]|uniref:hypothetical protein n=1 Tax=Staphylococcus aureus TaxID=1280 RepID=UPI00215BD534|nr:hypothetical protein [Staphylococcus aureus]UVI86675.1 hypothetical protein NW951_08925 [Staphylococcus aureus]UVJ27830.1 hypothetical protein NW963_08910 [Staphylococcus aureus]
MKNMNLNLKSMVVIMVTVIIIVGLYGCGKKDGDEIVGKEFKVIQGNRVEGGLKFGENGDLTAISATGKYNAGKELKGKYQIKEFDGKQFLILTKIDTDILNIQNFGYRTATIDRLDSKENEDWYIYQIEKTNNNIIMYDLTYKKGKADKFKSIDDLDMLEIRGGNEVNSTLEPVDSL